MADRTHDGGGQLSAGALCARLREATERCLARLAPLFLERGRRPPGVVVRCDLRGSAAGQFRVRAGQAEIRYNLGIAELQPEAFLTHTVPHETAHLAVWHLHGGRARPHGPEWQSVMHRLGIDSPRRCHDFALPETARRQRRWPYRCGCGPVSLSTTRHRRVLEGRQRYRCSRCGQWLEPDGSQPPKPEMASRKASP